MNMSATVLREPPTLPSVQRPHSRDLLQSQSTPEESVRSAVEVERLLDAEVQLEPPELLPHFPHPCECCRRRGIGNAGRPEEYELPPKAGVWANQWLSQPTGEPTTLTCVIHAWMICYSIVWLFLGFDSRGIMNHLGCQRHTGANVTATVTAGSAGVSETVTTTECDSNTGSRIGELCMHVGVFFVLISGSFILHSVRVVTHSPRGYLARMGLEKTDLPGSPLLVKSSDAKSLRRGQLTTKAWFGVGIVVFGSLALIMVWQLAWSSSKGMGSANDQWSKWLIPMAAVGVGLWLALFAVWWSTLRLAVVLTNAQIDGVRRATKDAIAKVNCRTPVALSDEVWRKDIEEPCLRLARETMPLLSTGWGIPLAIVSVGLLGVAVGGGTFLYALRSTFGSTLEVGGFEVIHLLMPVIALVAILPVLILLLPAGTCSTLSQLDDEISELRRQNPRREEARIGPLQTCLCRLNGGQGMGFCIVNLKVDRKLLWRGATLIYAVLTAGVPLLLDESLTNIAGDPTGYVCPPSWTLIDGTCYKLVAADEQEHWLTQPGAALACSRDHGGRLARIRSRAVFEAVLSMAKSAEGKPSWSATQRITNVWIDGSFDIQSGRWLWSDGSAMVFQRWMIGQPADNRASTAAMYPEYCSNYAGQRCISMSVKKGYYANPCVYQCHTDIPSSQVDVDADTDAPKAIEYEFVTPYVCERPLSPRLGEASAGAMHGCYDSEWLVGQAHARLELPPTLASGVFNASVFNASTDLAPKARIVEGARTAAECVTLVRERYPTANAAEYSNVGMTTCAAVFGAQGIVLPSAFSAEDEVAAMQVCLFVEPRTRLATGLGVGAGRRRMRNQEEEAAEQDDGRGVSLRRLKEEVERLRQVNAALIVELARCGGGNP